MGQTESLMHVPNPLLDWKSRLSAEFVQTSEIVHSSDWKMNTLACLPVAPYSIFAARGDSIYVYRPSEDNTSINLKLTIKAGQRERDSINQLRMLDIGGTLRLVGVFDSGLIAMWDPQDPNQAPTKLQNDGVSTWSLAASSSTPFLYVGSNSHEVASYDLSADKVQSSREIVTKHGHNVPCIDITPCGKWMATTSIDGTVRISEIATQRPLRSTALGTWGWSCKWILKKDVLRFKPRDQIGWLAEIYGPNARKASLDSVDTDHYDALKDDSDLANGPVTKKRVLNFPSDMDSEIDSEMDVDDDLAEELIMEDEEEEELEIEAEENGFEGEDEDEVERDAEEANVPCIDSRLESNTDSDQANASEASNPWQSADKPKTELAENDSPDDYLLSVATLDEVLLFNSELKMLSRFTRPLVVSHEELSRLAMVDRFSILHWIPEWSLLVAANQGLASILFITVRFNITSFSYELVPELRLPLDKDKDESFAGFPLSGVDLYQVAEPSNPQTFFYRVTIRVGDIFVYDVRLANNQLAVTPSS